MESMYHNFYAKSMAVEYTCDMIQEDTHKIIPTLFSFLTKVYTHPTLLFLYEGPKIALAIMMETMRKKNIKTSELGKDINWLIEQNRTIL